MNIALIILNLTVMMNLITLFSKMESWIKSTRQFYLYGEENKVKKALNTIQWQLESDGILYLRLPKNKKYLGTINPKASIKNSYISYRQEHWKSGYIHHDDVLFFSYQLITRYPFILEVIRSKFPYFFIDEFQDCNPIQMTIIKKISEFETIVGCIGDPAQSIYEFQAM